MAKEVGPRLGRGSLLLQKMQKDEAMTEILPSMGQNLRVIVVGASGGIGRSFVKTLANSNQVSQIYALSREAESYDSAKVTSHNFDLTSEPSIQAAATKLSATGGFDLCILATGLLQGQGITPEKNLRALSFEALQQSFMINTFGPAITAKYFLPLLRRDRKVVLAALSARVGSISDNRIGGWYAYRASKAALNMLIKTLSIEVARRFKNTLIVGLHPGTVDTDLSKPFQRNVPDGKLFSPEYSVSKLLGVIDVLKPEDSGSLFAWDGKQIPF